MPKASMFGGCLTVTAATLLCVCAKADSQVTALEDWHVQASMERAVRDWLDCQECTDGELDRLLVFGEQAETLLQAVGVHAVKELERDNYEAGAPFQLHWVQQRERQRFNRLAKSNPAMSELTDAETFARNEIHALLKRYLSRSSIARKAIKEPGSVQPADSTDRRFPTKD